ncbi:MAG TPA: response regulator [Phenylobacterium sp.]|jgi:two-component system capsular synthesis sensor histidine kinase RcsC|uniref:response regulator n=1 Tax=Phenylobacterium sp. TaxID=1871053 RepID=UPI002C460E1C|nr:response regulator [Phenylobacterium sp.]HXA39452.1 response regulator [Phenylobacterium sp.]
MTDSEDELDAPAGDAVCSEFSLAVLPDDFSAPDFHLSVLVADDHPTHRRCAQAIFEALGCHVFLAVSGAAALHACSLRRFDVVVMDRHMPDGHGDEAVRRLRRREGKVRRTFVACCSSDPPRDLSAGYDVLAPKPLTVAAAADLLRRVAALAPPEPAPGEPRS